jgi:hypothetical protein
MHLPRPPSIDPGTSAGLWAIGFALYIFLGMLAIGISLGTAFVISVLALGLIFLFIRVYGRQERRRPVGR